MSFSNRFGKGLLASLESEEEVVDTVDAVDAEDADNVEAAMADVAEVETEISETSDAIDQGAQDADALNAIADTVEETEQEGGAEPVVAQVAEVAVEAIYKRLGLSAKPIVSIESFGDKETRIEATRVAVEEWRKTAKTIWDAIVNLFNRIKDFIVNFFESLFVASERTLKRAKSLKEAAAKAKGAPKESNVNGSFVRTLAKGKTFDKAYALKSVANLTKYAAEIGSLSKTLDQTSKSFDVAKLVGDKGTYDGFSNVVIAGTVAVDESSKKWFGLKSDENTYWAKTNLSEVGSSYVAVRIPKESASGESALKAFSVMETRVLSVDKEILDKDAAAPALNQAEIEKLIDSAIDGMEAFNKQKAETTKLVNALSEVQKKAKEVSAKSDEAEAGARGKVVAGAVRGYGKLVASIATQTTKQAVAVAQAGLDYAQKSLKNIGVAEEAEAK